MGGELQPGDPSSIGPYRLVEVLGSGGMGRVYLGRTAGGRRVAVKVIRPELAADAHFRVRFRREVAAARRVNGLFTAVVLDADTDGPVPWLATAHIDAPSLADAVRAGGPLPPSSLRDLAAGLAEGLAAIHEAGLVHRDLKPSNVLLAGDGPRIIDFGIAWSPEASSLTGTDAFVGSPGYMSPEQARAGREVGPASDVFTLGAVLCFAATGRGPWGGGPTSALVYRVVHEEPDLADVPAEIHALVARCLDKDPAQRPTPAAILAELNDGHTPTAHEPGPAAGTSGFTVPGRATSAGASVPAPRTVTVNAGAQLRLFAADQPRGPVVAGEVPQAPPAFQPRDDLIAGLRTAGPGMSVVRAVTGMRGVGKTQLAAAYARECRAAGWRLIAWVNAEDAPGMLGGLAVVADRLGIERAEKTLEAVGAEVRNRLEADGDHCLIVFDNVTNFDVVRPYAPALGAPQVVITTTEGSVTGSRGAVQVGVFSQDEALVFLAERTGRDDPDGARALAEELGFLPLALAQAAAVIVAQHLTYPVYLARLRAHPARKYLPPAKGDPYPRGAAEAILLSVSAVTASDPEGLCGDLLGVVSLLSAEGVSREILYLGQSAGIWTAGEEAVDEALARLADASLLTFSGDDSVLAHRMVMRVIRERAVHSGTLPALAAKAADLLKARTESLDQVWRHRSAARECARQVTALADHLAALPAEAEPETLLALRRKAIWHLMFVGDSVPQAIELADRLVADTGQRRDAEHPDMLAARTCLAMAHMYAGRPAALALFEALLADCERVLGESPDTRDSRYGLARAYVDAGRAAQAVPLFAALADYYAREVGDSHPDTLSAQLSLATAYALAGRVAEALPLFETLAADCTRLLGESDLTTLISRNNLACAYLDVGRVAEALPLIEAVLADCERVLGVTDRQTLESRQTLARAYRAAGRLDEALPLFERVMAEMESVLGAEHPATADARKDLANARQQAGERGRASSAQASRAAAPRTPPPLHPGRPPR